MVSHDSSEFIYWSSFIDVNYWPEIKVVKQAPSLTSAVYNYTTTLISQRLHAPTFLER